MTTKEIQIGDLVQYRDRWYTDPEPTYTSKDAWGEIGIVVELTTWVKHLIKQHDSPYSIVKPEDSEWPLDAVIYINSRGVRCMAKLEDIKLIKKGAKDENE